MSRTTCIEALCGGGPVVLPSLLMCDFGNLAAEIQRLEAAGVEALHLDVMDGNFVPNLTYGLPIVEACRRATKLPLDVHLMIERPEHYVRQFIAAGADLVTVHVEATSDPQAVLAAIHADGAGAGIALNPDTPLSTLDACLDIADLVLVMSVPAGFGGQSFRPVALEKLNTLRSRLGHKKLLEVDGGVNRETIRACSDAGATLFVVGSAIFKAPNYDTAVAELTELAGPR